MKLLLIRHAQSANNLLHATTGSSEGRTPDPALTALGWAQARHLAAHATGNATLRGLTHLYASLTTRAVQTAAPLAATLKLPVHGLEGAHECGGLYRHDEHGQREGLPGRTHADLRGDCPALTWPPSLAPHEPWPGGFEDEHDDVYTARAGRVVTALRAQHGPEDVVGLITHQYFAQFLLAPFVGGRAAWLEVNNTATCLLHDGPDYRVIHWLNRHDHLPPELVSN